MCHKVEGKLNEQQTGKNKSMMTTKISFKISNRKNLSRESICSNKTNSIQYTLNRDEKREWVEKRETFVVVGTNFLTKSSYNELYICKMWTNNNNSNNNSSREHLWSKSMMSKNCKSTVFVFLMHLSCWIFIKIHRRLRNNFSNQFFPSHLFFDSTLFLSFRFVLFLSP